MPRGITQEQVDQAADAIVATGERPTVEKVRASLGTGSPNTVTRMLDGWRQGLAERLRQASLLPELPDEVGQAMTALWTLALQHARAQAQNELQAEREALQHTAAALDSRAAEQEAKLKAAEAEKTESHGIARLAKVQAEAQQQLIARLESTLQEQTHERERLLVQNQTLMEAEARLREEAQAIEARAAGERERWQQHVKAIEDRAHAQVDQARVDERSHQQRIVELIRAISTAEREASRQRGVAEALTLKLSRGNNTAKTQRKRTAKAAPRRRRHPAGQ